MLRPLVEVRDATPDDLPDLLALWAELRDLGTRIDRSVPTPSEEGVLARLHRARLDPDVRVLVATWEDEVVGMAVLTHSPYATLFDASAVHVHYLHVREAHRRRGVGRALLGAAAAFAEEVGAESVMTSVFPQLRDTQRFYARLGFGPLVVRRVASVAVLRRKLAAERAGEDVLARRRSLRARSRVRAALSRTGA